MTPGRLAEARAAVAEWEARCQHVYPITKDTDPSWPPDCSFSQSQHHRIESDLRWAHPFTYDPAADHSPLALLAELLADRDRLVGLLGGIEWVQAYSNSRPSCPACGGFDPDEGGYDDHDHDPDCWLAATIETTP